MDQAFILDTSGNNVKGEGLIGLGPNSGSNIHAVLKNSNGDTPLDRIFRQNHSTPNYISIYLGRSDDPTDPFPGDLTIGHPISPFENITSMPKLPVFEVSNKYGQHWQTLVDEDGIIGPDGQPIKAYSRVKNGGKSRLNVIFDTGFSLPQVPKCVDRNPLLVEFVLSRDFAGRSLMPFTLECRARRWSTSLALEKSTPCRAMSS